MPSHAEFKLSITRALTGQLLEGLHALEPEALTAQALTELSPRPGVYQLYEAQTLVYVGSAARSLPQRLGLHMKKLSGRQNIEMAEIKFSALYVDEDMTVLAPERQLIDTFRSEGLCEWNTNGFGNKDPGRERDTTVMPPDHWDVQHPIDLGFVPGIQSGEYTVSHVLTALKSALPFNLRFERKPAFAAELSNAVVIVGSDELTAHDVLRKTAKALSTEWQLTALPGYVILYKEKRAYPQAEILAR